ncbi:MAG: Rieske 2Fe-2S domain-containing protein [Magnetococcales bacterium]|nr:Rieske 2Fe-2S domain-containing protein [Magnetococcales bacterium]
MSLPPWNEHPQAPDPGTIICFESAIPKVGGLEFTFGSGNKPFRGFLLKKDGEILAYLNACTHFTGTPLNPNGIGNFLDPKDPSLIYCGVHGSRFLAATGACVSGECDGEGLQPIPVKTEGGKVIISS